MCIMDIMKLREILQKVLKILENPYSFNLNSLSNIVDLF